MSVNSSSLPGLNVFCGTSKMSAAATFGFSAAKLVFVVPLCAFVLHMGLQRRRQGGSPKAFSHSDVFTYHLSGMELFWVPGFALLFYGSQFNSPTPARLGFAFFFVSLCGGLVFHTLTCVDRYLAVVHPVLYLRLKGARGAAMRRVLVASVWLYCLLLSSFQMDANGQYSIATLLANLAVFVVVITFCSAAVLCALVRPGPGDAAGERERVDQLKLRAFQTISVISSVLWLWFVGLLVGSALTKSPLVTEEVFCLVLASVSWLNLPVSLVLPVLYLQRAGKLPLCCCRGEK